MWTYGKNGMEAKSLRANMTKLKLRNQKKITTSPSKKNNNNTHKPFIF